MQDVVIIPTYDRPEMLWLCLDHIAASPECQDMKIRVYVDAHVQQALPKQDIETVIKKFPQLDLEIGYRPAHGYSGNSFNVMMAYRDAFELPVQHVFMIEDDVMIQPGFFAWHRQQHLNKWLGASIAVKKPAHGVYASLGVCFRRETLRMVIPHCKPAYFQNMRGYCRTHFPPSTFECEQDGLFARLLNGYPVVWANPPLAQHVGWYGYHRRKSTRPKGTLVQRYFQVKKILANADILREMNKDYKDIEPYKSPCN